MILANCQFADEIVKKRYLAQQCAIAPQYAQAIYDLLPAEKRGTFTMEEVAKDSKTAHLVGKDLDYVSGDGRGFMGMPVPRAH